MHKDIHHIRKVAKHIVGATSNYDAWLRLRKLVHEIALCRISAIGASSTGIPYPRHRVEPERERYRATHDARRTLIVLFDILYIVAGLFSSFNEQLLVIEAYTEFVGYSAAKGTATTAERTANRYHIFVGKHAV